MPWSTVAHSNHDPTVSIPMCSCGWVGTETLVPREAWREKARHDREHREADDERRPVRD